jgi:phosphoglucomutase
LSVAIQFSATPSGEKATACTKAILKKLSPSDVRAKDLVGEPITALMTKAPDNNQPINGLKVVSEKNGWFAASPLGTEYVYKIYAESFKDSDHLHKSPGDCICGE